jgi:hypothetical protein
LTGHFGEVPELDATAATGYGEPLVVWGELEVENVEVEARLEGRGAFQRWEGEELDAVAAGCYGELCGVAGGVER